MRIIEKLILHSSASSFGNAELIKDWHTLPKPRGNGWPYIAYSYVVLNGYSKGSKEKDFNSDLDGKVEKGININNIGYHCKGENSKSLGICLIGGTDGSGKFTTFSKKQRESVLILFAGLCIQYNLTPDNVEGHYETDSGMESGKTCPEIVMPNFRKDLWKVYQQKLSDYT